MVEYNSASPQTVRARLKRVVQWMTLLLLGMVSGAALWIHFYAYGPGPIQNESEVVVTIERGSSSRQIGRILAESGLIGDDLLFPLVAKLSGKGHCLQAGEFSLETGHSVVEVIEALAKARPIPLSVTIPEGLNGEEIAALLESKGLCERQSYETMMRDRELIDTFGLGDLPSLEGYLFPDTYHLDREEHGAVQLITMQVKRFNEVWEALVAEQDTEADRHEVVILASMVEKETGKGEERPLIAGVFYNRLAQGMRLQSDPTVVYGVKDYDGTITRKQLQTAKPYNTSRISGCPAGPIANPGRAAIKAVLQPAETSYLYFVAKDDGSHHFSENLQDHNKAVKKYQR